MTMQRWIGGVWLMSTGCLLGAERSDTVLELDIPWRAMASSYDGVPLRPMRLTPSGPAIRGETLEITVQLEVAVEGLGIHLPVADGGAGLGICPGPLDGACLGIVGNIDLETVVTDATGAAVLHYEVPATHGTDQLAVQAVVVGREVFLSGPVVLDVHASRQSPRGRTAASVGLLPRL